MKIEKEEIMQHMGGNVLPSESKRRFIIDIETVEFYNSVSELPEVDCTKSEVQRWITLYGHSRCGRFRVVVLKYWKEIEREVLGDGREYTVVMRFLMGNMHYALQVWKDGNRTIANFNDLPIRFWLTVG